MVFRFLFVCFKTLFFRILGLWRSLGRLFCSAVGGFFVFGRFVCLAVFSVLRCRFLNACFLPLCGTFRPLLPPCGIKICFL